MVISAAVVVLVLVVFAARAEGREVSRATSNDGGAWLINRELNVVGHKNRSAGEISMFMRVTDSVAAEVHQAEDVVVVHDPETQTLLEVDVRGTFTEDLQPTDLPELSRVTAIDGGVLIIREEAPGALRYVDIRSLTRMRDTDAVEPLFVSANPILVEATSHGSIVVLDLSENELTWFERTGAKSAATPLSTSAPAVALTIVGDRAVVLLESGDLVVVDRPTDATAVGTSQVVPWDAQQPRISPRGLQQPSSTGGEVHGVSEVGNVLSVSLADLSVVALNQVDGTQPLRPIAHEGCVHVVVVEPATYAVQCPGAGEAALSSELLDGAGTELRLRLVNGWVWINDLADGGVWTATTDALLQMDDWGRARERLTEAPVDSEGGTGVLVANDEVLIEDPDGVGEVTDSDAYDPAEVNIPPDPEDDEARTRSGQVVVVAVLENDVDLNNDILLIDRLEMLDTNGTVAATPRRNGVQFAPNAGFVGQSSFRYWVSDGRSEPVAAVVSVSVVADDVLSNEPPVPVTDVVATAPGNRTTIDVLLNDVDPDGDVLALKSITAPTGTVVFDPSGQVTYTPDTTTTAGWIELPYIVRDDFGAEALGLLRVEIRDRGANQEPDARNDSAVTVPGRPVSINLLDNDTDPDGDALILGSRPKLLSPLGAEYDATSSADGEFVFSADELGTYLFSYTITDSAEGGSERDTARIRIDVLDANENRQPVAVRDNIVIPIGQTRIVYVLDNDGDPDGDVVGITDWAPAAGLTIDEFVDDSGHVGFRVTAMADGPLKRTFTYTISDGTSEPVSASVVVATTTDVPRDQPPTANDDVVEARAGATITGLDVLANDFDPERGYLVILDAGDPVSADVTISPDGQSLNLKIDAEATASFDVAYSIEDSGGNRASGTLRVQLLNAESVNRPPVARADTGRTGFETPLSIPVLNNDSDPDGDTILLEGITEQPAFGTAEIDAVNRSIVYRPDPGFAGTDQLRYSLIDALGARDIGEVFVGVMPQQVANNAPTANDDSYVLTAGSGTAELAVTVNDTDPEADPLRVVGASRATTGQVELDTAGVLMFTPPDTVATATVATFSYTVSDGAGNTDDAVVSVTINPALAPTPTPTATPTSTPAPENANQVEEATAVPTTTPTTVPVSIPTAVPSATAVPPTATSLPATATALPPTATAVPTATPTATPVPTALVPLEPPIVENKEVGPFTRGTQVTVDVLANATDPDGDDAALQVTNVTGAATISGRNVVLTAPAETSFYTFTVADADGQTASGQITVFITANEAPIVAPLTVTTAFETPITIDLSNQATDPDGDELFFVCCANERRGGLSDVVAGPGQLSVVFTPDGGFHGSGGFSFIVDDQFGHQISGSVSVVVEPPLNQAPTAAGNTVQIPQDDAITVALSALVSDADGDELVYTITRQVGVTVSLDGANANVSVARDQPTGAGAFFDYEVSDGELSASATVQVTVSDRANAAPTAENSSVNVPAGGSETVDLAALSADPDQGDLIAYAIESGTTAEVTATVSGTQLVVSAPVTAEGAAATIVWSATDLRGDSTTAELSVAVEGPTQPPPQASPDTATTQPSTPVTVDVLANDSDFLGQGLTVVFASTDAGTASPTADGQAVLFDPESFVGLSTVSYRIVDAAGREANATIAIETVDRPGTPSPPSATATAGTATLTWTQPSWNGSDPVGYIVTHDDGGRVELGNVNNYTWEGLTNGQDYTFSVIAVNGVGESDPSGPSLSVTPDLLPEAPAAPVVTFLDSALLVTWSPPTPNGGSEILDYQLSIEGSQSGVVTVDLGATHTWPNLTNGEEYTFRVQARNQAGLGLRSPPSAPEHPERPPQPPTIGTTVRGDTSLQVNWDRPTDDGGGAIEEYRVTIDGGATNSVFGPNNTTYAWASLVNGTERTFTVEARNRAGWSRPSNVSVAVKPCGRPTQPGRADRTLDDAQTLLTWAASDGQGCGVNRYRIVADTGQTQYSTSTSHLFGPLENGTPYTFRIWAENEEGDSDPSDWSFTVMPAGEPLCGSLSMTATASGVGQISLQWTPAIDNGRSPLSYQRSIWGGPWADMGTGNTYTESGLTESNLEEFSIRAVNEIGESPTCVTVSEHVWERPWIPTISASVSGTSVTFNTTQPHNTTGPPVSSSTLRVFGCGGTCDITQPLATTSTASATINMTPGSYTTEVEVCNVVGCRTSASDAFTVTPPIGTVSVDIGTPSTGPCWTGSTQGCFNVEIVMAGWPGQHTVRCFSTMNDAPDFEFASFTAGNGTHQACSYTMAGRAVRVTIDGAAGDPNSGSVNVQCGQWPTTDANEPFWNGPCFG